MCGKIMTVLLIFVVLNCSMARYNGRLHCIVGVLPTCYKRKAATYFYPRVARGSEIQEYVASDRSMWKYWETLAQVWVKQGVVGIRATTLYY